MSVDRIAEMIAARQAPGVVVRKGIRAGRIRDRSGREIRTIYAGETQAEVERDLVEAAHVDGFDLNTATVTLREERGQGVGRNQDIGRRDRRLQPSKNTVKVGTPRL